MGQTENSDQDPKSRPTQAEYDRLLHRRKGVSGSEFAGVGIQFAAIVVLSAFAGVWLDNRFGTSPLFVLLLVFLGGGGGFWSMVHRLKKK